MAEPVITDESLAFNLTNEGGVTGTFRLLKNVMGLWLLQECRRTWESGSAVDYAGLTAEAEKAAPLGLTLTPTTPRFSSRATYAERIRAYLSQRGLPLPESRGEMVRCILESLALKYRYVLERLQEASGRTVRVIHIVGGGSQNQLLNQMTADATGCTVVAGPVEATATGNILMQAIATGELSDLKAGRALVHNSFELKVYQPKETAAWDEVYGRFVALLEEGR